MIRIKAIQREKRKRNNQKMIVSNRSIFNLITIKSKKHAK